MIDYATSHRQLSRDRLLVILITPDDYEAQAVTSAREELIRRGMTEVAIDVAIARFDVPVSSGRGVAAVRDPAAFPDLLDVAEFDARAAPTWFDRWWLPGIAVYAGVLALLSLAFAVQSHLYWWNVSYAVGLWEPNFLPLLLMWVVTLSVLGACVLFWRRSHWGWIGVTVYFAYTFVDEAFWALHRFFVEEYADDSGLEALLPPFKTPTPTFSMTTPVIAVGVLLALLLLPRTRAAVGVRGATVSATLGVGVLLGVGGVIWGLGS